MNGRNVFWKFLRYMRRFWRLRVKGSKSLASDETSRTRHFITNYLRNPLYISHTQKIASTTFLFSQAHIEVLQDSKHDMMSSFANGFSWELLISSLFDAKKCISFGGVALRVSDDQRSHLCNEISDFTHLSSSFVSVWTARETINLVLLPHYVFKQQKNCSMKNANYHTIKCAYWIKLI